MFKTSFYIKMIMLSAMVFTLSCRNDQDDKKAPDVTKAPVGNTPDSTNSYDTASFKKNAAVSAIDPAKTNANQKDNSAPVVTRAKNADKKIKENKAAMHDTAAAKSNEAAALKKDNPATNQPAAKTGNTDAGPAVFKSKYGTIPRDANQSNMTVFYNTFPDKNTLIKINFDGPADAEMNNVKMQIIKILKKSGYVNVQEQSATIEPQRMPKEIHYELQRDGSVVFWVPIANQEQ